MNIQLDEGMKKQIVHEAVQKVASELLKEVRSLINPNRLAEQIRDQVKGQLVSQIAGDFHKKLNTSDLVNCAMNDAEQRINARIKKALEVGIRISLKDA